jgi:hypothetical protein
MRNIGTFGGAWLWTDGSDVWAGAVGDHSGAEIPGSRRAITEAEYARWWDPAPARQRAREAIDDAIGRRIAQGATLPEPWAGKVLSLSLEAQLSWGAIHEDRETWDYPFLYPTIDDRDAVTVTTPEQVAVIWATGKARVQAVKRAGTLAKLAVNAATSRDEIDAIVTAYLEEP